MQAAQKTDFDTVAKRPGAAEATAPKASDKPDVKIVYPLSTPVGRAV